MRKISWREHSIRYLGGRGKRTLLKTPKKCFSQIERGSLVGLAGRRFEVETRSLFDSLARRFCRIRELAIAAISPNRVRQPRV
ncbi:hypothetical protein EYF80_028747 [Liparis tanakae]|uniref:Uncharacterized protein n=1 Tax=Liparis tanakae TaxID=230148 RepID=A0A4Z2H8B1_9TELE|nr:hypothetical protein EYF80_028747 [Liparis tanakae]